MKTFIKTLPKAELHLHIEGSLEPELLFKLAKRNNVSLKYKDIDELKKAYEFDCLQDFLDIYYQGASVLLYEKDFYDLTWAYLEKCKEQNVTHTEIMFDPQTHTDRGVQFDAIVSGIYRATQDAKEKWGITSFLIMSFLRHLSEEEAFKTLEQSKMCKEKITAVGLDSSEKGNPPSKFKNVFKAAVDMGYIPLAHAGEEGDASYIWEALDLLKIVRIDHGNNALQDPKLIEEIKNRDIALTVCPLSNTSLQVVKDLKDHPLKQMMDLGLKVTINSDDPAYFGGQVNKNYEEIQKALNLTKEDIYQLVKNSFNYSLLKDTEKAERVAELAELYDTIS